MTGSTVLVKVKMLKGVVSYFSATLYKYNLYVSISKAFGVLVSLFSCER